MAAVAPAPVVKEVPRDWESFSNVTFDLDKAVIRPDEKDKIKAVADYMQQNPKLQLGLAGNTDPQGTLEHNQVLSDQRTKDRHVQGRYPDAPDVPRGGSGSLWLRMTPWRGRPT